MSGSFEFLCSRCDQRFRASRARVGARLTCPRCHHVMAVPTPEIGAVQLAERAARRKRDVAAGLEEFVVYDAEVTRVDPASITPPPASVPASSLVTHRVSSETVLAPAIGAPATPGASTSAPNSTAPSSTPPSSTGEVAAHDDVAAQTEWRASQPGAASREIRVPRYVLYIQAGLLVAVALGAFVLGALFGGLVDDRRDGEMETPQVITLRGSVAFQSRAGVKPDVGSVVMVLPSDMQPAEPLDARQFRAQALDETERLAAGQVLQRMGGALDAVDADGHFAIQVPRAGDYWLLVMSNSQPRPRHLDPPAEDLALLGHYFRPAWDLVGENQYRWQKIAVPRARALQIQF